MSPKTHNQVYEELKDLRRRGEVEWWPLQDAGLNLLIDGSVHRSEFVNEEEYLRKGVSLRHLELRALADRVFGDEKKADAWLHRPNPSMAGQIPLDLIKDELGAAVVREALEQIDHGIFA
jgi:hypothetical protein